MNQGDRGDENSHAIVSQTSVVFSGPLPPPQVLKQYNDIVPGAADRVLSMAEEQSKHRQHLERYVIRTDGLKSVLGLLFAFGVAVIGLISGAYSAIKGQPLFGATVSITVLGGIVYAFIYGTRERMREVERKREEN